jgi:hypothetical protein
MSTKGSPPNTVNVAPPGGQCASQQCGDDNSESPDISSRHASRKDSQFGKHTKQYHLPHGYSYPPSLQSFPGAPQFYHQSPFSMTHSLDPASSASEGYPLRYMPPWQGYDLHHGGHGGSEVCHPVHCAGQELLSPATPRVPPGLPGNHPVNHQTSSSSTTPP